MLRIGITGGIGSGKSTVCRIFKILGIPIFDADMVAKTIMEEDVNLMEHIKQSFGTASYVDGRLDRAYLAQTVFNNQQALNRLNALVHPVVIQAGEDWFARQHAPYAIKEAALLFESGSYKDHDYNILVSADKETRIRRVMARDGVKREQVLSRIEKQMPEEQKQKLADFTIDNNDNIALIPQVLRLHADFLERSGHV